MVGLEIDQPELVFEQHHEVGGPLDDEEFTGQIVVAGQAGDGGDLGRGEADGEGKFAPDLGSMGADFAAER